MLHSSSCRNTHWNPHSQAAGTGRKVRETENCSKRRNEKRKYLPSHLPVPTLVNLLRKYSFLSFLHSSSPPPSCFLWACKCQTAVTTALSLFLDLLLSLQGLLHAAEAEAHCSPTIRYGLPSIPSLSDWCWVRVEERGNGRGNDGNRLLSGRQLLKPLTPPRRYQTSMQKWSGDRE